MALADYADVIHRCFRCGYCRLTESYSHVNCPAYQRFRLETYSPGGMLWLARAWATGETDWTDSLAHIFYACTACGSCAEHCKFDFGKDVLNMLLAAREEMVQEGLVLPQAARFFKNIEATGNPFRYPPAERGDWVGDAGIPSYDGQEYLYFVGCVGSYEERAKRVARQLGELLLRGGVSFGILGDEERCDGGEVGLLGEKRIQADLVRTNTQTFSDHGVNKIITLSPHSYDAFRKHYPRSLRPYHYTQVLRDLIESGALDVSRGLQARVTYHDPCFLGRHNSEYEAPRAILGAIPGVELMEMERNRASASCCGGGSGNFYIDSFGGGPQSPARSRVREARDSGAQVLAVACPVCITMLSDAATSEGLEEQLVIQDIAEIVAAAVVS